MDQIYNFEGARPPILNEKMLRAERERREIRIQTILFSVAAVVVLICITTVAVMIAESAPIAALVCISYVTVTVIGSGAAAIVYAQKGGAIV